MPDNEPFTGILITPLGFPLEHPCIFQILLQ